MRNSEDGFKVFILYLNSTTIITNERLKLPGHISPGKGLFVNKTYLKNVVLKI